MGQNQARTAVPRDASKEPVVQQIASFVGFFIYLLVLKSFFLPLFVIPTGSMAETLYGAHAVHTCPNCGFEYPVGVSPQDRDVPIIRCPNCGWQEFTESPMLLPPRTSIMKIDGLINRPLHARGGDRIMVHGWTYDVGGPFEPQRWDVVVFKVPSDLTTNYIKRLIGKPDETIEIIDGDIYVAPPGGELAIALKPRAVQESLWFPSYNHDFLPLRPAQDGQVHPRWIAVGSGLAWHGLDTRRPRFEGGPGDEGRITFVTEPGATMNPGQITDAYGYDRPYVRDITGNIVAMRPNIVSDVRLSCAVDFDSPRSSDAFLELSATKNGDTFFGRLYADGRLTLEQVGDKRGTRELWGSAQLEPSDGPVALALSSVDYVVSLEVDGVPVLRSTPEQYSVDVQRARAHRNITSPRLLITAGGGQLSLDHLLIERDVFYTSELRMPHPGYGTQGHPIELGPNDYFMLGDNSPFSQDSRFSFVANPKSDPLLEAYVDPDYQRGTVPGDQLIGPAFLVYWPGMAELLPDRYIGGALRRLNILPMPGRIRWIR